jgi:hypothetical protein
MIVLGFVVLLTGLALAYFSRTTVDRQLARSSYNDTSADLLALTALDMVVGDLKQEILSNPTVTAANIQPAAYPIPTPADIPNLIRYSSRNAAASRASGISSAPPPSATPRRGEITLDRWNSHYLVPRATTANSIDSTPVSSFIAPDWVLVTPQGPSSAPPPNAVIGRYAFAVYDEGGLLDMNLAGFPLWTGEGGNPNVSPTPWATNIGRKGTITFADLTALASPSPTSTPSQTLINKIVGWRNWATTQQPSTASFGSPDFAGNLNRQNSFGSYLLDFGDPPYTDPSNYPFTAVNNSTFGTPARTDQAFTTRQQLISLLRSLDPSGSWQNRLRYMGTFSRERNRPAPDWPRLGGHLPDRFAISNLGLVKPYPDGAVVCRGQGHGQGNSQGCYRGRGRNRGTAAQIRNMFGLLWVRPDLSITDPRQLNYWGHWLYAGIPGMPTNCDPGQGCDHIPALRGGSPDFFQILDYALTQANGDGDDALNVADVLSLGASLIDQYDNPADDLDIDPSTPAERKTHVTIIGYGGGRFVLGWETGEAVPASTNPYNPTTGLIDPVTGTTKPTPTFTPITLDHAFTTTGEFGYGLRPELTTNRFQRLSFNGANSNASILDFFTYNPVGSAYPRAGMVNLNTRNVPVIAAILQGALKRDIDQAPPLPNPFPTVPAGEASLAAQDIVNATRTQASVNRQDIGRLTAAAASRITVPSTGCSTSQCLEKVPEAIARALSEVGQARTWNLFIDVIAQTGRYAPGTSSIGDTSKFTVEGEKRYWLHIALGRDLNADGSVDVLGSQLEAVMQ